MHLPVTHMTLYKHGVGFFQRRAQFEGQEVALSFRTEEMNDVLKSLTAIDWGAGKVLGLEYATPQSDEERLKGCSIRLSDRQSLRDLLMALRGRSVRLLLDQQEQHEGLMVGLDEVSGEQPLATTLVSLLLAESREVRAIPLGRVQGVDVLDDEAATDLRFFLETALGQEEHRQVTVRLTPGEHDLSVSYVAPAPTWRVSYRIVAESESDEDEAKTLLLGWGIFDNKLEEDLEGISLALVAGMPISFIYDLYEPFTPKRPVIHEEGRVAAGPVEYGQVMAVKAPRGAMREMASMAGIMNDPVDPRVPMPSLESVRESTLVEMVGEDLGELFQYAIATPVTVGRGQSAMVPIVSANLKHRKDLLYNGSKMPEHPVATLRMNNDSGLTLERGPATVLDDGHYAGEAMLPFTADGAEIVVGYAVELGAKVREDRGSSRETHGLRIEKRVLLVEEWDIRWIEYSVLNSTNETLTVLIEHPRLARFELFETSEPKEQTQEHRRFEVEASAGEEVVLRVQERKLVRRREALHRRSVRELRGFLKLGLLDHRNERALGELLALWHKIAGHENRLEELEKERAKIFKAQDQIQGNMKALDKMGKEGQLRASYVDKLEASEGHLQKLAKEEVSLQAEIKNLEQRAEAKLQAFE